MTSDEMRELWDTERKQATIPLCDAVEAIDDAVKKALLAQKERIIAHFEGMRKHSESRLQEWERIIARQTGRGEEVDRRSIQYAETYKLDCNYWRLVILELCRGDI